MCADPYNIIYMKSDNLPSSGEQDQKTLNTLIASVRRKIFLQDLFDQSVRASIVALPAAALLLALRSFLGMSVSATALLVSTIGLVLCYALVRSGCRLKAQLEAALALDTKADLRDRVGSALSFLRDGKETLPHLLQIKDAIDHARQIHAEQLFRLHVPVHSAWLALGLLLLVGSLLISRPPQAEAVQAVLDDTQQQQLDELKSLQEQLEDEENQDPELLETVEKLRELQKQFEKGDLSDRDLMIELARLDEQLRAKTQQMGVQHLENQLNVIVPHLMSSSASKQVAAALKEDQLDKAMEALKDLSDKAEKNELTDEEKKQLAMNFGAAAAKLGKPSNNSFAGEFAKASESMETSDTKGFCSACKSMGDKLGRLSKSRKLASACKKIGECKSCIGMCNSQTGGYKLGQKTKSNKKGGLAAGTGASDEPLADASRLKDSYLQLLQVKGMAGDGAVKTETEITEGQLSASQVAIKDLHADFSAVAEEVIENETIPLSHRFHVKRYFQTIRPQE